MQARWKCSKPSTRIEKRTVQGLVTVPQMVHTREKKYGDYYLPVDDFLFTMRQALFARIILTVWSILSVSVSFVLRDQFQQNTFAENPELFGMLERYIFSHNAEVVLSESSVCNRHYVVATYACPQAMGNHFHEFLNNFAGAFITNRTVVWKFCTRKHCLLDNENDCNEHITRFPWMLSVHDLDKRWITDKCTDNYPSTWHQLIGAKFKYQAEQIMICCGLDEFAFKNNPKLRRIEFGTLELHEMYALASPSTRLNQDSKDRAAALFRLGEDFGYGVLFRTIFKIKDSVTSLGNSIILQHEKQLTENYKMGRRNWNVVVQPFYIGIHLRHAVEGRNESHLDSLGADCINTLWNDFNHNTLNNGNSTAAQYLQFLHQQQQSHTKSVGNMKSEDRRPKRSSGGVDVVRPCVILIASDRKHEIDLWKNTSQLRQYGINCTVLSSNHAVGAHKAWNEHGPFSGALAVQDLDLLSRSDVFIGSTYTLPQLDNIVSTFSMLIAALRATNGRPHVVDIKAHFLPNCTVTLGAKHELNEVYVIDKRSYQCGDSSQMFMPRECPYWNKTKI